MHTFKDILLHFDILRWVRATVPRRQKKDFQCPRHEEPIQEDPHYDGANAQLLIEAGEYEASKEQNNGKDVQPLMEACDNEPVEGPGCRDDVNVQLLINATEHNPVVADKERSDTQSFMGVYEASKPVPAQQPKEIRYVGTSAGKPIVKVEQCDSDSEPRGTERRRDKNVKEHDCPGEDTICPQGSPSKRRRSRRLRKMSPSPSPPPLPPAAGPKRRHRLRLPTPTPSCSPPPVNGSIDINNDHWPNRAYSTRTEIDYPLGDRDSGNWPDDPYWRPVMEDDAEKQRLNSIIRVGRWMQGLGDKWEPTKHKPIRMRRTMDRCLQECVDAQLLREKDEAEMQEDEEEMGEADMMQLD